MVILAHGLRADGIRDASIRGIWPSIFFVNVRGGMVSVNYGVCICIFAVPGAVDKKKFYRARVQSVGVIVRVVCD